MNYIFGITLIGTSPGGKLSRENPCSRISMSLSLCTPLPSPGSVQEPIIQSPLVNHNPRAMPLPSMLAFLSVMEAV
ncbi:hypothetical protein EI94DRAFT_1736362 [Lactarius quietus]|nr:hypothetical protein EI94DRAFT_1736362 [Lactarius quietus]